MASLILFVSLLPSIIFIFFFFDIIASQLNWNVISVHLFCFLRTNPISETLAEILFYFFLFLSHSLFFIPLLLYLRVANEENKGRKTRKKKKNVEIKINGRKKIIQRNYSFLHFDSIECSSFFFFQIYFNVSYFVNKIYFCLSNHSIRWSNSVTFEKERKERK